MIFERGKLVDDHGVEVKGDAAVLNQPLHIFTIDNGNVGTGYQCSFLLCRSSHSNNEGRVI